MAGRTVPYKLLFADVHERDVARAGLGDLAALDRTSVSRKIVSLLLDEVLTTEPHTRWYMEQIYSHLDPKGIWDGQYGVVDALMDAFTEAAVYPFGEAFRELATFTCTLLRIHRVVLRTELYGKDHEGCHPFPHLFDSFDTVCTIAEQDWSKRDLPQGMFNGPAFGRTLASSYQSEVGNMAFNLVSYLLDYWDSVGNSTYTYRALRSLLEAIERWDETAEDRVDFARASSITWAKFDEVKSAERRWE